MTCPRGWISGSKPARRPASSCVAFKRPTGRRVGRFTRFAASTSPCPRRDGRAARAERGRQVDHDRHAARPPDARRGHAWRCSARRPSRRSQHGRGRGDAPDRRAPARADRARAGRDDGRALPAAARRSTRCSTLARIEPIADRRTQKLSRRRDPARPIRHRAGQRPRPARARRADGRRWTSRAGTPSGRRCARFAARGKTVVFATHYLEEADAYADRAVLMARGRVVADGPTTEIKAMVGSRTIRATLPDVAARAARAAAGRDRRRAAGRGGRARLLRLGRRDPRPAAAFPEARDIEISGAGLEEAFLELTGDETSRRRPDEHRRRTRATSSCARSATGASSSSRSASRSSSTT